MDPISFGRIWPETVARVRRHTDLLWPLAAAFLFLPQLLVARHVADRTPGQLFTGEALVGDAFAIALLLLFSTFGQLVMARIVAHDGTRGQTLGTELRVALSRLPVAIASLFILVILFMFASFLPAALAFLVGGGNAGAILAVVLCGFWLAARLGIVLPLVATNQPEPVSAITTAWRLTRGRTLRIAAMLTTLLLGFLLLFIGIAGLGAAAGVISTMATGPAVEGWGIGRWLYELINTAASAALGTFYIAFLTVLAQALGNRPQASA